jgi:AraC-like DNA-binding protein
MAARRHFDLVLLGRHNVGVAGRGELERQGQRAHPLVARVGARRPQCGDRSADLAKGRAVVRQQLLREEPERGVASVAAQVGYESQAAFSRAFKRLTGEAPATWHAANATRIHAELSSG